MFSNEVNFGLVSESFHSGFPCFTLLYSKYLDLVFNLFQCRKLHIFCVVSTLCLIPQQHIDFPAVKHSPTSLLSCSHRPWTLQVGLKVTFPGVHSWRELTQIPMGLFY